jgi:hypothetical protein
MRGRLYYPVVGRFMQADPIISAPFFSEGLNPYRYVFNNPPKLEGSLSADAGAPAGSPRPTRVLVAIRDVSSALWVSNSGVVHHHS